MKAIEILKIYGRFTDAGIEKLISTVESVLPHTPGNWEFMQAGDKLEFIFKNKEAVDGYIHAAKPVFSDSECDAFNWFNSTDDDKIKRLGELQSASVTLRYFSYPN